MTKNLGRILISGLIATLLILIGCVSASRMLERAEDAWARGQYAQAIEQALSSYEKAVDQNKDPGEIDAARAFLEERFPMANANLVEIAERRLAGSDAEKATAWEVYQTLVGMNRRVRDSIASSFLSAEDYGDELQKAKETAAQIKYVKVLELIGEDRRSSYIEAAGLLKEIDGFVPDYRDIRSLLNICYEEATLIVAFSDSEPEITVLSGAIPAVSGISEDVNAEIRSFIERNDNPDFLEFVTAGSAMGAADSGAVLFVEVQGQIWLSADVDDRYLQEGTITWERSYDGTPTLVVTRLSDSRTETATADLEFAQSVKVEFFPEKYDTDSLTVDMYNQQFNNPGWMASQLNQARNALRDDEGSASMVVWAEMLYGGVAQFLETAMVPAGEGVQEMPIDPAVYANTATFINGTLPSFLEFTDIDLSESLVGTMADAFLGDGGVADLLGNLEG